MSKKELELAELSLLMEALCEERLSAEDKMRLEEIVLSDPDAMQFYLNYSHLHGTLYWDQGLGSDVMVPIVSPVSEIELPKPIPKPAVTRRKQLSLGLATACLLVLFVVAFNLFSNQNVDPNL
ncbi:MAG: hypothetical protein QM501_03750, partial [Gimesia sp.]